MSKDFQQVNYSQFRSTIAQFAGNKVKNSGLKTFVYDHKNRMLAVLKAASIDAFGKTSDAEYYIRHAA